jgi:hypothetical protein
MLVTSGTFCGLSGPDGPDADTLPGGQTVSIPSKKIRPAEAIKLMLFLRIDDISESPSRR